MSAEQQQKGALQLFLVMLAPFFFFLLIGLIAAHHG